MVFGIFVVVIREGGHLFFYKNSEGTGTKETQISFLALALLRVLDSGTQTIYSCVLQEKFQDYFELQNPA